MYISPGAIIIANVRIGDAVAIGGNAVVTKNFSNRAVVVGVPAKKVSYKGSNGYVDIADYDRN